FGKELAMALHELSELVGRVFLPRVRCQERVEVGQHVLDALHRLRIRRLKCLLDASEWTVQNRAGQHVLDRLEDLARFLRTPRVVIKSANSASNIIWHRV